MRRPNARIERLMLALEQHLNTTGQNHAQYPPEPNG